MEENKTRVLLIDDDEELAALIKEYLYAEGFDVATAFDGDTGLKAALDGRPSFVILDVMLPGKNGFDVLRELRKQSKVPVLMLTARGEETERIVGLEIGADDYMPKPFNPRELVARIRAILRRSEQVDVTEEDRIEVGDLEINRSARYVAVGGIPISLTGVEFDLLKELSGAAGNIVKKEELSLKVLDRELSPYDRSLDMHVSNLRKKLGLRSNGSDRIKTIRAVGYIYTTEMETNDLT